MANVAQRSFAGGEIAPPLYARTDISKYHTSARTLLNMFVQKQGSVTNRSGTEFICAVKDSSKTVRLIEFIFNNTQTYVLEFGDGYIRFIKDGVQLESSPGVPYEIVSPYLEADLMELRFIQSADVITIAHPDYAPRDLSRTGDTAWTLETIVFGASIGSVANLSATGGVAGGPTYYAVTAVDQVTGEEGLPTFFTYAGFEPDPTTPVVLTWDPLTGADRYIVYRSTDGSSYEQIAGSGGTPTTISDNTWVDDTESVTLLSPITNDSQTAVGEARNDVIAGGVDKPYNDIFTIKGYHSQTITCPTPDYNVMRTRLHGYYKRDAEARVYAGVLYDTYLPGTGDVSQLNMTWSATMTVPDNGYAALQIDIVPEVILQFAMSEGAASSIAATVEFTAAGWDVIERSVVGTGFTDDGSPGDPLSTPPLARPLFDAVNKYPTAVTIYQQRKLYADTNEQPEFVYASRTGAYKNFLISNPLQDDDAVTWSQAGRQVNSVKHMIDLGRLIVFTLGGEMSVEGDEAGILRPDAINPRQISYNGSDRLPPLPINNSAVYVQARQTIVRDLTPINVGQYESTDLTVAASHMFMGYALEDWAYSKTPHSILWVVRNDGTLLGLTYIREEEMLGWHRHQTDGTIERVCVVPEGDEDRLYMVVARTVGGNTVRYIERMATRFFETLEESYFVDCGLSYVGAPATVFSGLGHLEGRNVAVLADGVVVNNPNDPDKPILTVTGGSVTLAVAASEVHIGLPYVCDFQTLDIDKVQDSFKDRKMLINKVVLFVEKSTGFYVGAKEPSTPTSIEGLYEHVPVVPFQLGDDLLITEDVDINITNDWNSNGRVFVRQIDPLPLTILAAIPTGNIG